VTLAIVDSHPPTKCGVLAMIGNVLCVFGAPNPLRRVLCLFAALALAAFLAPAQAHAAVDPYDGNWRFSFSPYLWLPSLDGTLQFYLPNGSPNVDASAGDLLEKLDFAFMATGDVRRGNWSVFTDFIYLDLSNENATVRSVTGPGGEVEIPIDVGTQTELKGFLWTLAASYTLLRGPAASLDVFAGVRDAQLKATLDWQFAGPLGFFPQTGSASDTTVVWNGIIGLKGRIGLGGTWFLPYYADVGWGSFSSTWQALIGVGYGFRWGDLLLTYRHLHYSMDEGRTFDDMSLSGPMLGATFRF
jgi:hypothetical protein